MRRCEASLEAWERLEFATPIDDKADFHAGEAGTAAGSERHAAAVAVSAHIDTVFPAGTPLEVHRDKDGKLHGPSVSDNSSGVVALRNAGLINDEVMNRVQRDIDLEASRLDVSPG